MHLATIILSGFQCIFTNNILEIGYEIFSWYNRAAPQMARRTVHEGIMLSNCIMLSGSVNPIWQDLL